MVHARGCGANRNGSLGLLESAILTGVGAGVGKALPIFFAVITLYYTSTTNMKTMNMNDPKECIMRSHLPTQRKITKTVHEQERWM